MIKGLATSFRRSVLWIGMMMLPFAGSLARAEKAVEPIPPQGPNGSTPPGAAAAPAAPETVVSGTPENVYRLIPVRNPFGLASPPVQTAEEAPPPPPLPPPITVKLSGLTDLLGRKVAFLVLTEAGANKTPRSRQLGEGEKESGVEVLAIDFNARSVKVNNNGLVTNVGFGKLEASGAAPSPPTGVGGGTRVLPNFQNGAIPPPIPPPGLPTASNNDGGNNNSVIIGGQTGGDVASRGAGRSGSVFTSGAYPASSLAPSSTGGGGYSAPGAVSTGGGSATSFGGGGSALPPREPRTTQPRTGAPRFQIPMPPPLPDPSEFSRGTTPGTGQ